MENKEILINQDDIVLVIKKGKTIEISLVDGTTITIKRKNEKEATKLFKKFEKKMNMKVIA